MADPADQAVVAIWTLHKLASYSDEQLDLVRRVYYRLGAQGTLYWTEPPAGR